MSLAVFILTYNEELHIGRAIASLAGVADEIVVIDSYSTDMTVSLAEDLGATVYRRAFRNQADQFNWALDNIQTTCHWTMRLDADEYIDENLAKRIVAATNSLGPGCDGILLNRRHVFMGRWIKWGGRHPLWLLRVWRSGTARAEMRWMDEHIVGGSGEKLRLDGAFFDENLNSLGNFSTKHIQYARREAYSQVLESLISLANPDEKLPAEAKRKRQIKRFAARNIPFYASSLAYLIYRLFVRLGVLDGIPGIVYHVLQGFWYRFLVGAMVVELERHLLKVPQSQRLSVLDEHTGFNHVGYV